MPRILFLLAPLPAFAPVYIPTSSPVVVGLFATSDGNTLALFVNRDHDHAVNTSVYTASADGVESLVFVARDWEGGKE